MKVVIGDRNTGRTTSLIKMADNYNGTIVVLNQILKDYVISLAKQMNCRIKDPITYFEMKDGTEYTYGEKLYLDDFEIYLRSTLLPRCDIEAFTICTDEYTILRQLKDNRHSSIIEFTSEGQLKAEKSKKIK